MTAPLSTYHGTPLTNAVDEVRLLIGDTEVENNPKFTDNEIEYFISKAGDDPHRAAQSIIASQMTEHASTAGTRTIGKTTVTDNRTEAFKKALDAVVSTGASAAGGTAVVLFDSENTTPLIFDIGMTDNPESGLS